MVRYRHDGTADVIGQWNEPGMPSMPLGRADRARRRDADAEDLPQRPARARRRLHAADRPPRRAPAGARHRLRRRRADRLRRRAVGRRSSSRASAPTPFAARARSTASPAFTELVAQALANAEAREQLAASRARVVAAGDTERRRLERNLHDGAQQRLVALSPRADDGRAAAAGRSRGGASRARAPGRAHGARRGR